MRLRARLLVSGLRVWFAQRPRPRIDSHATAIRRAVLSWRWAYMDGRARRRARRIIARPRRRYPWALELENSIASPHGMGADGQYAYDLTTRTWFGTFIGNVIGAGAPTFDPTNPKYLGGAKFDGVTDDTQAWLAAIADAQAKGGGKVGRSGSWTSVISALLTLPAKVDVIGGGGYMSAPASRFLCTAAAAGLLFTSSGGLSSGFYVDGGNLATVPLQVGNFASFGIRTFEDVSVANGAGATSAGWLIQASQNCTFVACNVQQCAGDGLALDLGTGGNLFLRFESNQNGRYNLNCTESGNAPSGVSTVPQNTKFVKCIFERSSATTLRMAFLEAARNIEFDSCNFADGIVAGSPSMVELSLLAPYNTCLVRFHSCIWNGDITQSLALIVGDGCLARLTGTQQWSNILTGLTFTANATISMEELDTSSSVTNYFGGAGAADSRVNMRMIAPLYVTRQVVGDSFLKGFLQTDAGQRLFMTSSTVGLGPGTAFVADVGFTRNATARTGIIGSLHVPAGGVSAAVVALVDAANVATDSSTGWYFTLAATAGRTISAPTNAVTGREITYEILNSSGGAMVTTWNAVFTLAGAWVDPANTKRRVITFRHNGTNWVEQSRTPNDI